jgi:hypothetical protein
MMGQKYMITETEKSTLHQNSQLSTKKRNSEETISKPIENQGLSEKYKLSLLLSQVTVFFETLLYTRTLTTRFTFGKLIRR